MHGDITVDMVYYGIAWDLRRLWKKVENNIEEYGLKFAGFRQFFLTTGTNNTAMGNNNAESA